MRKLLLSFSLAGLLLTASSVRLHATSPQKSDQQTENATKTVDGKISSIGNGGHSFALEVNQGGSTQMMQFAVDKNAKVQGTVKVGTPVSVEYQPSDQGQNVAVSITAQGQ